MDNKDWLWTVGVGAALLVLWWLARQQQQAATIPAQASNPNDQAFPVQWDSPMVGPFAANSNFNSPPSNINININNPFANQLSSEYMPLFGMVGIAQGAQFE